MIARFVVGSAAMLLIAGCGEKPQTLTSGKKPDTPSWQGTQGAYTDPGWKAGDRKAWEEHLKVRTQRGQNEYARGSGQI